MWLNLSIPIYLLIAHFIGDFILQSDEMAIQKSKDWVALTVHVSFYSICFIFWGVPFYLFTLVSHFITDAITSRITSKLWFIQLEPTARKALSTNLIGTAYDEMFPFDARVLSGQRHWFFTMIGLDQLIHYVTLAVSYHWLAK